MCTHSTSVPCYKDIESMVDLHTIPMFHANGWGRPQASTMHGIKQVMVRRFEPTFVFHLIQEHKATDMCLVPTMANALIHAPDLGDYDLSSMRRVMIGGAASSPEAGRSRRESLPLRRLRRLRLNGNRPGLDLRPRQTGSRLRDR
jgi:acyl-CoA synthetase (AMP-forming)/AMP-acid ligase II